MRILFYTVLVATLLLQSCNTTPQPETGPDHPVQLPPPSVPDGPDYDPHLLIPQWDWQTEKWGYIDRTSREAVIPHIFRAAGRLQRGVAYATTLNDDETVEDVYRITADGQYQRIHQGDPEYWKGKRRRYQYSRLGDDYFFVNQGDFSAMYDPAGNRLWDTIGNWENFVLSSELPAYLGDGHIALNKDGYYDFRDRDFKTVARFDTTEYLIFFPSEIYDWVRTGHQIPLIPALDLKADKMGYLDRFGTVRIPFKYDRSELLDTSRVRSSKLSGLQYSYRFDWCGHALVYSENTPILIDTSGKVVYRCPDSLIINEDPLLIYNKAENTIVCQSRKTGWDHVIDLDDEELVFSGKIIYKLSDAKYVVETGTGLDIHIAKMVDRNGTEIAFNFGDSLCTIMPSSSIDYGFWEVLNEDNHTNILTAGGDLIGDWEFQSAGAFSVARPTQFFTFYNRGETEGIFREKYTLTKVFLANGDSVTGTMKNVDTEYESYNSFTALSNENWDFETTSNMLFHMEFRWQEHRCRGFIDAFGHYYILD